MKKSGSGAARSSYRFCREACGFCERCWARLRAVLGGHAKLVAVQVRPVLWVVQSVLSFGASQYPVVVVVNTGV